MTRVTGEAATFTPADCLRHALVAVEDPAKKAVGVFVILVGAGGHTQSCTSGCGDIVEIADMLHAHARQIVNERGDG